MGIIHQLDYQTANQIAAGEVVERPASVIKELVENSLDAGASRIDVIATKGGKERILVVDNGIGMTEDDAKLCVERHATSKIKVIDDLFSIQTLGFRGEALPSIASVSKLNITTRHQNAQEGIRLELENCAVTSFEPMGCPQGTQVEVKELFFNTPARKKFLKSDAYEQAASLETIHQLAMAYPAVAFRFRNEKQVIFQTAGNNKLLDVLMGVYGRDVAAHLIPLAGEEHGVKISGYIGLPNLHRSNRFGQTWFVNKRVVRFPSLSRVVEAAYKGRLPIKRYPFFTIFLEVSPARMDVNTHPTKLEVKLEDEDKIAALLIGLVNDAIQERPINRAFFLEAATKAVPSTLSTGNTIEKQAYISEKQDYKSPVSTSTLQPIQTIIPLTYPAKTEDTSIILHEPSSQVKPFEDTETHNDDIPIPLAQLHNMYILAQTSNGLIIVDQHAAHERIIFQLIKNKKNLDSQELLIPVNLSLIPQEEHLLIEYLPKLRDQGIILEHFGGGRYLIRSVPVGLKPGEEEGFVRDLLEHFASTKGVAEHDELQYKILSTIACRSAVKAGARMTHSEMAALLRDLNQLGSMDTCPHGRPYIYHISSRELERRFGRG